MNIEKLKLAEAHFLQFYPGGFQHPDMQRIAKKHPIERLAEQTRVLLAEDAFVNQGQVLESIVKLVSRSSMVSMFEKPKFRDFVNGLGRDDRSRLAQAVKEMLHGDQVQGFEALTQVLLEGRIAKWSLVSILMLYSNPTVEVFVKPTTAKAIIVYLELTDLTYRPRPSWEFYAGYRQAINTLKLRVDPSLSPSNAAFTGFLMMSVL
jgi:hypothetical protein